MKKISNKKLLSIVFFSLILILLIYLLYYSEKNNKYSNFKGKHLTVYVALREEEARCFLEKFKNETGCTYEYIKLPTEEAEKRILSEKNKPKGDIFIGGTCDAYELLKSNDAFRKI